MADRHVNDARIVKRGEGDFQAFIEWDEDGERTTEKKKFASFDEANQWLVEQEAPVQTDVAPTTEPIDTTKLDDDSQPAVGSADTDINPPTTNPSSPEGRDPANAAAAAVADTPAPVDTTQAEAASNNLQADNAQLKAEQDAADAEQAKPADQNS